jgi:hypothetical protein
MPIITTCTLHKDAAVSHLIEDPCPLCRALDEVDHWRRKYEQEAAYSGTLRE